RVSAAAKAAMREAISDEVSDMAGSYHIRAIKSNKTRMIWQLSCRFRPLGPAWIAPVDPFQQIAELCTGDGHSGPALADRPDELARLQPLQIERHADAVMPEDLDQIAFAATEAEDLAAMGITAQALLHL